MKSIAALLFLGAVQFVAGQAVAVGSVQMVDATPSSSDPMAAMATSTAMPASTVSSDAAMATSMPYGQASATYSAEPYVTTAAPSSVNPYDAMPYTSMTAGGYSSMGCGYGYQKDNNGYCSQMSWVRLFLFFLVCIGWTNRLGSIRSEGATRLSSSTTSRPVATPPRQSRKPRR